MNNFQSLNISNAKKSSDMTELNYGLLRYQADNVPTFDGNPKLLQRFISASENLLRAFQDIQNPNAPINICLLDTIYSKLSHRAADLICSRSEINNWQLIKELLINTFSDQRSIDCLIQDMLSLKINKNENPIAFGMRLQDTRSLLFSKLNATDEDRQTKLMKIQHYDSFALKTYINNLPYNIQLVIRLKEPISLEQAMSFVQEEENFQQFKFRSNFNVNANKPPQKQNLVNQSPMTNPSTSFQTYPRNPNYNNAPQPFYQPNFSNNNSQNFPRQPIPITPRPNFNQRFPTNKQVFGKPINVWRPGNTQNTYKPTPMSVTTRNTTGTNNFQNNKPNQLFNQEVSENVTYENPFEQPTENNSENIQNDYTANHSQFDQYNNYYPSCFNDSDQINSDIDYTANQSNTDPYINQNEFENFSLTYNVEQQPQQDFYETYMKPNTT